MNNAIINALKSVMYAMGSCLSAFAAFCEHSLPVVQWIGVIVAIAAGIASFRASVATHAALKDRKQ